MFDDVSTQRYLDLLDQACNHAKEYAAGIETMRVVPVRASLKALERLGGPLPEGPTDPGAILALLHEVGSPATVAQTGGRYFGFVNGGAYPPAVAARWLADVWDQNTALEVMSPLASRLEEVCEDWLVDLLGLPESTAMGLLSGTSTSLLCGVATARNHLLERRGWDVNRRGLFGAPALRVVVGRQAHVSVQRALALTGLGFDRVESVDVDGQGRMSIASLPTLDDSTLVIAQAGNVNSGAFDQLLPICERAREAGAWVHVDGAFGLWAAACKATADLVAGVELADSWSADAHKTLNVPYDCGFVLCRDREALTNTLMAQASYISWGPGRDGMKLTPEMSRRARVVELWTTLKALGREGVATLVARLCSNATKLATNLEESGFRILNDVVFNQVLVACDTAAETTRTLEELQASGECWCGGTAWLSAPAIRLSVCSWATDESDIERTVRAFTAARERARAKPSA